MMPNLKVLWITFFHMTIEQYVQFFNSQALSFKGLESLTLKLVELGVGHGRRMFVWNLDKVCKCQNNLKKMSIDIRDMKKSCTLAIDKDKYSEHNNYEIQTLENLVNLNQKLKWDKLTVPTEYMRIKGFNALQINQASLTYFAKL